MFTPVSLRSPPLFRGRDDGSTHGRLGVPPVGTGEVVEGLLEGRSVRLLLSWSGSLSTQGSPEVVYVGCTGRLVVRGGQGKTVTLLEVHPPGKRVEGTHLTLGSGSGTRVVGVPCLLKQTQRTKVPSPLFETRESRRP